MSPEQNLIVAIMKSGLKEKDEAYFKSEAFIKHCEMLGIGSRYAKKMALEIIYSSP